MKLKYVIQDLIDNKIITIDEHKSKNNHTTFKEPLHNYDKRGSSNSKDAKINYTSSNDNVINMLEVCEWSINE